MTGDCSETGAQRFETSLRKDPSRASVRAALAGFGGTSVALVSLIVLLQPSVYVACIVVGVLIVLAAVGSYLLGRSKPAVGPRRGLILDQRELRFDPGTALGLAELVVKLEGRFGATLLADRARSRVVLALTTQQATFYVGATVDGELGDRERALLASAFTVASDERALDATGPDGAPLLLPLSELERLYAALLRLDPRCGSRVLLTDARGELVMLDEGRLQVGRRSFDLAVGLEWHGVLFRESALDALTVYQGTHVRQGGNEVVFVSLLPALAAPGVPGDVSVTSEPLLERAVRRDMALLHERAEEPPPAELRVAIDRVFMLPLRAALNATRQQPSPQTDLASMPFGRVATGDEYSPVSKGE